MMTWSKQDLFDLCIDFSTNENGQVIFYLIHELKADNLLFKKIINILGYNIINIEDVDYNNHWSWMYTTNVTNDE